MGDLLVRRARLVPVGAPAPAGEVDVRIGGGVVRAVAAALRPAPGEEVLDAAGRWLVPGLWDQHVHMVQWARTLDRLDVSGTGHPAEVTGIVAAHVAALPAERRGRLVCGYGYRSAAWARQPAVAELDAVSGDHPVVLISADAHNAWLNSRALQLLGVPPRDRPVEENEWFALHPRLAELPGAGDGGGEDAALRTVLADAAAKGVVGVVDLEWTTGHRDWSARFAAGLDTMRVRPAVYPDGLDEVVAAGLRTGQELAEGRGLLTMGPLKIISDGSLNTRTAFCCEPYADAEGDHGRMNHSPDELRHLLRRAREHGLDVALHAIGDAAVAASLDAFAATGATGGVEHAQLVRRADAARMGRLGVRASVQPAHLLDDRDVTLKCWPDRADRCFPLRTLLDAGVELVLGSDAPVSPLDPWLAMAAAVHRSADGRPPWNPAEAISAAEALAASTDGRTTPVPGAPGDVVLLDDDPLRPVGDTAAVAAHLRGIRVAATVVAGRTAYLAT